MNEFPADLFRSLEASNWSVAIRQSLWLYPVLEIIHITGIVLVAGAAILFDLRLLQVAFNIPVVDVARYVLPWSKRGLILVIPSGILMFITNAVALANNTIFLLKLILLAFAGINALLFHYFVYKPQLLKNPGMPVPVTGKLNAILSIIIWLSIISCGRLIAYM